MKYVLIMLLLLSSLAVNADFNFGLFICYDIPSGSSSKPAPLFLKFKTGNDYSRSDFTFKNSILNKTYDERSMYPYRPKDYMRKIVNNNSNRINNTHNDTTVNRRRKHKENHKKEHDSHRRKRHKEDD